MRFAVTGSTGMIGTALVRRLRGLGHDVVRVVRSFGSVPQHERAVVWQPDRGAIEAHGLEGIDVAVNLAGENIAGVWTSAKKRRIRESRVRGTALLAGTLAGLERPPRLLISMSGVGFYGDRGSDEMDESSPPGSGFMAETAQMWEAAADPAREAGIRVVNPRLGTVMSREGGMLAVMRPIFRLGLGAPFGSGRQYLPWVTLEDVIAALLHIVQHEALVGPVNVVAPGHVTNAEFTDALAAAVGRPSILRVPKFAARLAPGGMADELMLGGARVVPRKLIDSGFRFADPQLRPALARILAET